MWELDTQMLLHTRALACQEQAISVSGPYASLPSSICLRLLKTSRTLAERYYQRGAGQRVGDVYLKIEVDESRTKCKETDSYLVTFLSHAYFDFSNLICSVFCTRVNPPFRRKYSILCCKPEQDICLLGSLSGLALLSFTWQQ